MNKKQGVIIGIAFVLLFTGIALSASSASSNVKIYAFDQNPAGSDEGNEGLEGSMSNENEVFDFIFDEMDKVTSHIELGDQYSDEGDWSNATQEYHNGSIEANYAVVWLQNTKVPTELKNVKEQAIAYFSAVSSYLEVAKEVAILKEKPPEYQENLTSKMDELNYLRDDVLFTKDDLIDAINDYIALKQKSTPKPIITITPTPTPIPSFEFLFAIIGVLAAIYLVKRRG